MNTSTRAHPVARVRGRTIVQREISCRYAPAPLEGDACAAWEQARLSDLLVRSLLAVAIERAGLMPSDEEVARDPAMRELSDERVAQVADMERRWLQAVLAVHDGEPMAAVSGERLARLASFFDSRDEIVTSLARIDPTAIRRQIIEDVRFEIGRRSLSGYCRDQAETAGMTAEAFAQQFWDALIRETGAEILDPRYRMISWRDLR